MRLTILLLSCLFVAGSSPLAEHSPAQASTADKAQHLKSLFTEEWEHELRAHPEMATELGDNRYNDQLGDNSPQFFESEVKQDHKFLARLEAFDPAGLPVQDALSRELMIRKLRESIAGAAFKSWEMPVNQMAGPHLSLTELVTLTPFHSARDYDNYLSRLRQVPRLFEQTIDNMRQGMRDGLIPPRYLLEKVALEAAEIAAKTGNASPFAKPLDNFPRGIPATEQARIRSAVLLAISSDVVPAYQKLTTFVREEYAPHGRLDPGVWALPDGDERYRFAVHQMTTTDLSPDEIHEIGLRQIAELEREMVAVAHALGFKDLESLNAHIKADRNLYATSGEQLLDLYTGYARQMQAQMPALFGRLPENRLAVIPMDPIRATNAVPADYTPGAEDGSRAGRINVNESDPEHRLVLNVEAIAYHEGIPGHHLQMSIGQEMPELPAFRRHGEYTAFVEGWALYAERLGKEIGFYRDPYSNYGRLENEMWRNIRLVIDTGVHKQHWGRDQMVEYFHRYTAMDEPNIQSEVDRYIAWPGQALAYKLGQLEILELREDARQKLGTKFDLRSFHDEVVRSGPLPLDVLHSQIQTWIATQIQNAPEGQRSGAGRLR
jgi:uncharacterized protein (DUF885 family)